VLVLLTGVIYEDTVEMFSSFMKTGFGIQVILRIRVIASTI
jgi:hypothetical protein